MDRETRSFLLAVWFLLMGRLSYMIDHSGGSPFLTWPLGIGMFAVMWYVMHRVTKQWGGE